MRRSLILCLGLLAAAPALSQTAPDPARYDGLYQPAGMRWTCTRDSQGQDGGALGIAGGQLFGVENTCDLLNPVQVRDMDAILFDASCWGEGESYSYRLMLMRSASGGVLVAKDGWVSEWVPCTP